MGELLFLAIAFSYTQNKIQIQGDIVCNNDVVVIFVITMLRVVRLNTSHAQFQRASQFSTFAHNLEGMQTSVPRPAIEKKIELTTSVESTRRQLRNFDALAKNGRLAEEIGVGGCDSIFADLFRRILVGLVLFIDFGPRL